jgi:putative hydrolase of HD superfamily
LLKRKNGVEHLKGNLRSIIDFQDSVERLKRIQREGWIRVGVKKPESVADHSYGCAVLSMIAGDLFGFDTERLIRMALLHDLSESITGDLTPRRKKALGPRVAALEKRAVTNIVSHLPSKVKKEYIHLIDDYRMRRSSESRFLRDLDRIEMCIQALAYARDGYSIRRMAQFLNSAEKDLRTDVGKALFEVLRLDR